MRAITFVVRCAAVAVLASVCGHAVGFSNPTWAAVSALIVMQERPCDTRKSLAWRALGTSLGAAVAVGVNAAAMHGGITVDLQLAIAVALCAIAARIKPQLRVALWTCPIVLLSGLAGEPTMIVGLMRASEVILGAVVAAALHLASDWALLNGAKFADLVALRLRH